MPSVLQFKDDPRFSDPYTKGGRITHVHCLEPKFPHLICVIEHGNTTVRVFDMEAAGLHALVDTSQRITQQGVWLLYGRSRLAALCDGVL